MAAHISALYQAAREASANLGRLEPQS
jgi:hypothetical protein